jgi:hypothetical protein
MRKLIAGFILLIALPIIGKAQAPGDVQRPRNIVEPPAETLSPGVDSSGETSKEKNAGNTGTKSDAYAICLRATQRFDQQEEAKGNPKPEITSLSTSCEEELKPASYWLCMEKEAIEKADFNSAHWRCAKKTKISK